MAAELREQKMISKELLEGKTEEQKRILRKMDVYDQIQGDGAPDTLHIKYMRPKWS